jgi:subtilisin family serine protease
MTLNTLAQRSVAAAAAAMCVSSGLAAAGGDVGNEAGRIPLSPPRIAELTADDYVAGRVLVIFNPEASEQEIDSTHLSVGLTAANVVMRGIASPEMMLMEVPAGVEQDYIDNYAASSSVLFAEPSLTKTLYRDPNDDDWDDLWGMKGEGYGSRAQWAWDERTGAGNVVIAVIDSGVQYDHPDLASNIWTNSGEIPGDGIDNDGNGKVDDYYGWDFGENDNDPNDSVSKCGSHGTHVAGTVGAVGNNDRGVVGVNWSCKIMALKTGYLSGGDKCRIQNTSFAIDYAVAMGAKVSNNSWGSPNFSFGDFYAIEDGQSIGHIFVASAGNDATNNDDYPHYPDGYDLDNVISVAAIDSDGDLADFSNYGAESVDIAAPGVDIRSTITGSSYGDKNGTSMASPHVAGAVALTYAAYPAPYQQVISRVLTARNYQSNLDGKVKFAGRLNVHRGLSIWGDFRWTGTEYGTAYHPFSTMGEMVSNTPQHGAMNFYSSVSRWTGRVSTPCTIRSYGGNTIIGRQ